MNKIKNYIENQNWSKAFSTARKFLFGIDKSDMRNIEIASDYLNGKGNFYKSLGIDCEKCLIEAKTFLINK